MSNSAFTRFGIERLSPSSLNLWQAEPGLWALRYLGQVKDETGPAMARGTAVEAGMLQFLHGRTDALASAHQTFDQNMQGEISDKIDDERGMIAGMIGQCQEWKAPGKLLGSQLKVEHWIEGVSIPVIGYLDFAFDTGDVDLKTTKACPSKPKPDHIRQVSLYRAARNKPGKILYVTEKRHAPFDVDDTMMARGLMELQASAMSLERFLSRFDDAESAIRCLPMNRDSFRWSKAAESKMLEFHL